MRTKRESLNRFYSLVKQGILIDFEEMELEGAQHFFNGDPLQVELYYIFIKYGAPFTKVEAMENVRSWYYHPEGGLSQENVEFFKYDSSYFCSDSDSTFFKEYKQLIVKALYENLHCGDASVEVTAAASLVFFAEINNDVISKLEYYANGTDSDKWIVDYTAMKFIGNKGDAAGIREIRGKAQRTLKKIKKG
ncbi:MAG: hypothetical protein PHR06_02480 [Candidatus Cloacimonetes bacterium]|nr:hypothetical protein [Candidatus Cloacimonadota bacterium]